MPGEFRGDFTRDTANPDQYFLRVLMQQGRVQIDADWNEQIDILLRYVQGLGRDLIGFHGGRGSGFKILPMADQQDFAITPGRYYVGGLPCEQPGTVNADGEPQPWRYLNQPYYTVPETETLDKLRQNNPNTPFLLAYLDVWERHISFDEDLSSTRPSIREVALGGPDTATRSQIVWQIKVVPAPVFEFQDDNDATGLNDRIRDLEREGFRAYLQAALVELKPGSGRLSARVDNKPNDNDPCRISPKSKYRGLENRLYRVEILKHDPETAFFAWSRYNSALRFPILRAESGEETVTAFLEHLGQDARYSLTEGDWVELVSDYRTLNNVPRVLLQVSEIDPYERCVKLKKQTDTPALTLDDINDPEQHAYLRRWDSSGLIKVELPSTNGGWLAVEEGIEIRFIDAKQSTQLYKTGDYWLIPARTVTGDIEWPQNAKTQEAQALPPKGITHYYAPLAVLPNPNDNRNIRDCRRQLRRSWMAPDES